MNLLKLIEKFYIRTMLNKKNEIMKYKILVPIDFGTQSIIALNYAKNFAKKIDAKLLLINIIEGSGILQKFFTPDLEERVANEANLALKSLAEEYLQGLDYEYCVRVGKPYEQIQAAADIHKPLMIVMGKTEEQNLKKRLLGSNTLHVIQETIFPVVSVRGKEVIKDLNNYLFLPLDLSRSVKEQVNVALKFAKIFETKIFVFTVNVKADIAYKTHLLTEMYKIKDLFNKEGIDCETKIVEGKKSDVFYLIKEETDKLKPLFTVIMVRDESRLDTWILGSIAHEIIRGIDYPILSVRPWDEKTEENPIIKLVIDPMNIL